MLTYLLITPNNPSIHTSIHPPIRLYKPILTPNNPSFYPSIHRSIFINPFTLTPSIRLSVFINLLTIYQTIHLMKGEASIYPGIVRLSDKSMSIPYPIKIGPKRPTAKAKKNYPKNWRKQMCRNNPDSFKRSMPSFYHILPDSHIWL